MNKLYISGNYIIAEDSRGIHEYAIGKSVYTVNYQPVAGYVIKEAIDEGQLVINTTDIETWYDEKGYTAYTEDTLVEFLRTWTGFSLALGGNNAKLERYENIDEFPATGDLNTFYLNLNTFNVYTWTGSAYEIVAESPLTWGEVLGNGNTSGGSDAIMKSTDKIKGSSENFINFNNGQDDGIFATLSSKNGFVELFEGVTWIKNKTLVRLESAGSVQLITEYFRLRDFSSNFESQIDVDKLTASRSHQLPDASGVFALESSIDETLTFGGGGSGDVATLTVTNGIITARTIVP